MKLETAIKKIESKTNYIILEAKELSKDNFEFKSFDPSYGTDTFTLQVSKEGKNLFLTKKKNNDTEFKVDCYIPA